MEAQLTPGQVVQVRSRRYLVQRVELPKEAGGDTTVHLDCLDDDAQGQPLCVFWEQELGAQVLGESSWDVVGQSGFDQPDLFSAYLHTLRWNCVTSTKPNLFQSPQDAPELVLAELLQEYRNCRQKRLQKTSQSTQRAAMLVIISLQKRLLSSIEAFARTLKVHRASIERQAASQATGTKTSTQYDLLENSVGSDDDRSEVDEHELEQEEDAQMAVATQATEGTEITQRELELLDQMTTIAEKARHQADGRLLKLLDWLKENLCPELGKPGAVWNDRRVLIFTEYTDTKRYLEIQLKQAIAKTDQAEDRIGTFHGGMGDEARELIKAAFNADPQKHPLRILIATDAAREGVNLQNYCADLFHFDVPWNPSRMEQRNGR
ncbi:MAG: helicase-related protein, partial [Prochlorotrichaceae cyanobacterium]